MVRCKISRGRSKDRPFIFECSYFGRNIGTRKNFLDMCRKSVVHGYRRCLLRAERTVGPGCPACAHRFGAAEGIGSASRFSAGSVHSMSMHCSKAARIVHSFRLFVEYSGLVCLLCVHNFPLAAFRNEKSLSAGQAFERMDREFRVRCSSRRTRGLPGR